MSSTVLLLEFDSYSGVTEPNHILEKQKLVQVRNHDGSIGVHLTLGFMTERPPQNLLQTPQVQPLHGFALFLPVRSDLGSPCTQERTTPPSPSVC